MHTFCLYCVNLWKANKLDCPQCRQPITSEGRNLVVDNMIDAMVANMSEEVQNRRKELVELRKALVAAQEEKKNLLKRNSADSSRARSRRPRQEASFRATSMDFINFIIGTIVFLMLTSYLVMILLSSKKNPTYESSRSCCYSTSSCNCSRTRRFHGTCYTSR